MLSSLSGGSSVAELGVMFVCLGNICRSPTAHGIFEATVARHNLQEQIRVDSAATGDWQIGKSPDPRALKAAKARGYDFGHLRARQITPGDFLKQDYVLAMDRQNLLDLQRLKPADFSGELALFLELTGSGFSEVPDPYHGAESDFNAVLDLLEPACERLLEIVREKHSL